jgi:hypothetical protein
VHVSNVPLDGKSGIRWSNRIVDGDSCAKKEPVLLKATGGAKTLLATGVIRMPPIQILTHTISELARTSQT